MTLTPLPDTRVRLLNDGCLRTAVTKLFKYFDWSLEIASHDPLSFRIAPHPVFDEIVRCPISDRNPDVARTLVARAVSRGVAQPVGANIARKYFPGGISSLSASELDDRLLAFRNGYVKSTTLNVIGVYGAHGLTWQADGKSPHREAGELLAMLNSVREQSAPAVSTRSGIESELSTDAEWDALLASCETHPHDHFAPMEDLLDLLLKDMAAPPAPLPAALMDFPSDVVRKALNYVFKTMTWTLDADALDPMVLAITPCYRFAGVATGKRTPSQDEAARTFILRIAIADVERRNSESSRTDWRSVDLSSIRNAVRQDVEFVMLMHGEGLTSCP